MKSKIKKTLCSMYIVCMMIFFQSIDQVHASVLLNMSGETLVNTTRNVKIYSRISQRVTASHVETYSKKITAKEAKKVKNWKKGYYKVGAKGYVTAKAKHSCTVVLYDGSGEVTRKRNVGVGKVSSNTGYAKSQSYLDPNISMVGCSANVYYDFNIK